MPNQAPPDQLEMLSRSLRMAIAADDFEAAAKLANEFQGEFKSSWGAVPSGREALLRAALDGLLGSLRLTIERRDVIRHQLDLVASDPSATLRRTPLSVSF